MESDQPTLRTAEPGTGTDDARRLQPAATVNPRAELVLDLLAATGLVPEDRLAVVKGRAGQGGSLAQALAEEGVRPRRASPGSSLHARACRSSTSG